MVMGRGLLVALSLAISSSPSLANEGETIRDKCYRYSVNSFGVDFGDKGFNYLREFCERQDDKVQHPIYNPNNKAQRDLLAKLVLLNRFAGKRDPSKDTEEKNCYILGKFRFNGEEVNVGFLSQRGIKKDKTGEELSPNLHGPYNLREANEVWSKTSSYIVTMSLGYVDLGIKCYETLEL